MARKPLRSTDKRRAGHGNNQGAMNEEERNNGRSKASANEFHAGRNGAAKRSL